MLVQPKGEKSLLWLRKMGFNTAVMAFTKCDAAQEKPTKDRGSQLHKNSAAMTIRSNQTFQCLSS